MDPIAIPYFSGHGHTRKLALLVAEGIASADLPSVLIDVSTMTEADWHLLDAAPAIVFGAPTYMGSAAAEFKAFLDATSGRWDTRVWCDKLAAGFTVASYHAGDKLSTLQLFCTFAMQHGMLWLGCDVNGPAPGMNPRTGLNADGNSLGFSATSSRDKSVLIDDADAETARLFGKRLAQITKRWTTGA